MKKVMFGLAAAAAISAFAIESANVVGYNTVTINKQYTILGIPFTGTTGSAMSIQDAVQAMACTSPADSPEPKAEPHAQWKLLHR